MNALATKMPAKGVVYALLAAVLFGITTPFAKSLLVETQIQPLLLAGLFYFGSSIGLGVYLLATRLFGQANNGEASLQRADIVWLGGAILIWWHHCPRHANARIVDNQCLFSLTLSQFRRGIYDSDCLVYL
jgi:hypothetical protein